MPRDHWFHSIYLGWLWTGPALLFVSLWWWSKRRAAGGTLPVALSTLAVLPGAMLWLVHSATWFGSRVRPDGAFEVHEYATALLSLLWAPALLVLLVAIPILRFGRRTSRVASALQAAHVAWALSSTVVALYFMVGI